MAERYTPLILDADNDMRQVGFDGIVMTAANFNAEVAKMEAIEAALTPFLLGKIVASQRLANFDMNEARPYVPPANHAAQSHTQWLFTFKEVASGAIWRRKVPTADYSKATLQDTNGNFYVDLSAGEGLALKAALDAFVTHPETGGAGALINIQIFEG